MCCVVRVEGAGCICWLQLREVGGLYRPYDDGAGLRMLLSLLSLHCEPFN